MSHNIENIIENKTMPFSEFIKQAEVGYNMANKYQVTYGIDFEMGMDVIIDDVWKIENVVGVEELTEKEEELIFNMVQDFKEQYIDNDLVA